MYYQCRKCRHQTTLTSGTLFQGTQLPLATWMLALYLLTSTKTDLSALELMRHLGVNYKSAWRIKHKVMQAMLERVAPRRLEGFVQIDDAYLGGERNGGKVGRGAPGKQSFVVAVETEFELEHPRYAVLEPVPTFDNVSLTDWCEHRLAPGAEVYSDGLACFARCIDTGNAHTVLVTKGRRAAREVPGARWVNVVLAQRQTHHQRALPRVQTKQIRAALSRRSPVPIQPAISFGRNAAAFDACDDALQPLA